MTQLRRLDAKDAGVVLEYGYGEGFDALGARDPWVFQHEGNYFLHYDAAGPDGWLASLAVSTDLAHWEKRGPVLSRGAPGEDDSMSASYGTTFFDGAAWHMFYLGTPHSSLPPNYVPMFPYYTMKAKATSPAGPWTKQRNVVPFRPKPGTYCSLTASPGQIVKKGDEYLQFFSATKEGSPRVLRTLGIARTKDLDGPWELDKGPILPGDEQIENSSLYYEPSNETWYLFTNHVAIDGDEYTDAVYAYWSKDLESWNAQDKAVVLDGKNCTWSKRCIGLPAVIKSGDRLAVFYDAPGGELIGHVERSIGIAWLDLPLVHP